MKLNPFKCTIGVSSDKFLGYIVTQRGIEAITKQIKAVLQLESPEKLKDVQRLAGKVAALSRFISISSDKCRLFYDILRKSQKFEWTSDHEQSFKELKHYLSTPPLLSKPEQGEPLFLYLDVIEVAVSAVLVREQYDPKTTIKSQAVADFVSDFSPTIQNLADEEILTLKGNKEAEVWQIYIDGASNQRGTGVGLILCLSNSGATFKPTDLSSIPIAHVLEPSIRKLEVAKIGELEDQQYGAAVQSTTNSQTLVQPDSRASGQMAAQQSTAGPYLRCLDKQEAQTVLVALHSDECGNNVGGRSLSNKALRQAPRTPMSNGQAESSKKIIIDNLRRRLQELGGKWEDELPIVLWSDRMTPKTATGQAPFSLVFGAEALIPSEVIVLTHRYGCMTGEQNNA
ncbi:uncharacterized protein LOC141595526 [Silene latifolia]|uniref:uncharacterized protein LOC141595526 n=1 Tax=Silene latifolia TaxID=37657 RepID=UPI003D787C7A